jgi:hypothetical protein
MNENHLGIQIFLYRVSKSGRMNEQRRGCVGATSLLLISALSVIFFKLSSVHEYGNHKDSLLTASTASSFLNGADGMGSPSRFDSVDERLESNDFSDVDAPTIDGFSLGTSHLDTSNVDLSNLGESDLAQDLDLKKSSDSTVADLSDFFLENPSANDNTFPEATPADRFLATAVDSSPAQALVPEGHGMSLCFLLRHQSHL